MHQFNLAAPTQFTLHPVDPRQQFHQCNLHRLDVQQLLFKLPLQIIDALFVMTRYLFSLMTPLKVVIKELAMTIHAVVTFHEICIGLLGVPLPLAKCGTILPFQIVPLHPHQSLYKGQDGENGPSLPPPLHEASARHCQGHSSPRCSRGS